MFTPASRYDGSTTVPVPSGRAGAIVTASCYFPARGARRRSATTRRAVGHRLDLLAVNTSTIRPAFWRICDANTPSSQTRSRRAR